jgi:hypothetical protein
MIKVDKELAKTVTWEQGPDTFDIRLHRLGQGHDEFIIVNPKYDPWILNYIDVDEFNTDSCVVWAIDNLWLVKKFKKSWTPAQGWQLVHCELDLEKTVEFNPEVKFVNSALREQINDYKINIEYAHCEHVWYTDDRVWVARARVTEFEITGLKEVSHVRPVLSYNKDIPDVEFDFALDLPYFHYDYNYELVWYLDSRFNNDGTKIWVAKFTPDSSLGVKDMGTTAPVIEYNSYIPTTDFEGIAAPYQDLIYEHVWYLDPVFTMFKDKIWAARITPRSSSGYKEKGSVKPKCFSDIEFEYNPAIPQVEFDFSNRIVYQDLKYDLVWYLDPSYNPGDEKIWAVKIKSLFDCAGVKDMGYVKPIVERNPDVPKFDITVENSATYIDFDYELVWYLDPKFNFVGEKVWLQRIVPKKSLGVKDMGYAGPEIEYNPDIPQVEFNRELTTPYQDLIYEHVWYLDNKFNPLEEKIWAAKIKPADSQGVKDMGYIGPKIIRNPAIPDLNFVFEGIPYYEFNNDIVWYLDPKFNPTDDNIWALKIKSSNPDAGLKEMGYASPEIIFNKDIPNLDYYIEGSIPYYDLVYEHVWMLDSSLHTDAEEIWAAKIVPNTSQGHKVAGNIGVKMADFDVVFISYYEPNAEANWQRVLEKFPKAKRVKNVQGIFQAHKQAAELADTPMFYVVDGDAELVDTWQFDFKPNVFDMDCVHLWTSINPINDLEYGYGGVKLFPRQLLLDAKTWNIDLTTGLGKLKLIDKISNVTAFNYDAFTTWRSAFRECAKLSSSLDPDAEQRLDIWCNIGADRENGQYAIDGAQLGRKYGLANLNNPDKLKLINNYDWMKNEFNEFYKQQ